MNKKESGFERIPNASPEEEKEILEGFKRLIENQDTYDDEREKTEEERKTIQQIIDFFPEFISRYGGKPLKVSPDIVHIMDKSDLPEEKRKDLEGREGRYSPEDQTLVVFSQKSKLKFYATVVHELMHLHAFASLNIHTNNSEEPTRLLETVGRKFRVRRVGFSVFDNKNEKRYFHDIDEAVIEELVMRFDSRYFKSIPALSDAIKERGKARDWQKNKKHAANILYMHTEQVEDRKWWTEIGPYSYSGERGKFEFLIQDIYKKNKNRFVSEEEVFNIFARATFAGQLLPIARLIEKTYGNGSFRRLAEKTKVTREMINR